MQYELHPVSIKYIAQGHPWVTLDKYSLKFDKRQRFIIAKNGSKAIALLLHEQNHKTIKARVWSTSGNFEKQITDFEKDLQKRLQQAFSTRSTLLKERDNVYLCFGEADQLPGLFIQILNEHILIQYFSDFWKDYQSTIINLILREVNDLGREHIWVQDRTKGQKPAENLQNGKLHSEFTLQEFDCHYKVILGKYYDHGIYTDMASLRKRLQPIISQSESLLNLYCYTGAYSIFALKNGVNKVDSVDLSQPYLEWLDENLQLNGIESGHKSYCLPVQSQLTKYIQEKQVFDCIISDPPSSSSNGKIRSSAFQNYEKEIPMMDQVLSKNGHMIVFLNTHNINFSKFEQKILAIIREKKLRLKIIKSLKMAEDCPTIRGFHEGNYLKGLILKKS